MALWTPEYIDTALWLDAADSSTITESGGAVSVWADKSGNNWDAIQNIISSSPLYVANELNELAIIRFDGIDDYMDSQAGPFIQPNTFFMVASHGAGAGRTTLDGIISRNVFGAGASDSLNLALWAGWPNTIIDDVSWGERPLPHGIYMGVFNGNDSQGWLNGVLVSTPEGNFGTEAWDGVRIGAHNSLVGRFGDIDAAELLIFDGAVTVESRQKIEGYLAHKWGLSDSLPVEHSYKSVAPQVHSIIGVITGADGNPVARTVRAYSRSTGVLLQETISNASTGNYILNFETTDEIQRIVLADETALYNDIIDRVIPG